MVGEGLAGPFPGDQDTASGVAEVLAAMALPSTAARTQTFARILWRDAVTEPVRAGWRARLITESVGELVGVVGLPVGGGLLAVAELLGQVLGR